jgi:hypothetical protein
MVRFALTATTLFVLSATPGAACPGRDDAPSPATVERAAVLAAMDKYLAAITAADLETMKSLQMPDGMTYRAKASANGTMEVVGRPNSYWVDPARKDGLSVRERYWSPTVLVRGSIAVVWAPYEFWIDGKTSHCGIDSFDFVKMNGRWLVANAMWTVEPTACAELRPTTDAELRPAD